MEQHINLPLAASFLKNYGQQVLGITSRKQRAAQQQQQKEEDEENESQQQQQQSEAPVTAGSSTNEGSEYVTPEQRAALKQLFVDYYHSVEKHLVKEHKHIKRLDSRNRETLFTRGELSEETKQNHEKMTKVYEKLLNNTQT